MPDRLTADQLSTEGNRIYASVRKLLLVLTALVVVVALVLAVLVGITLSNRKRGIENAERAEEQQHILEILEDATGPEAQKASALRLQQAVELLECNNRALLKEAFPDSPVQVCPTPTPPTE
jgi:flagellar basal body-associated protein FliL